MTNDEEIIGLLREIVENQRKSLAMRKKVFRFANWITTAALVPMLVVYLVFMHSLK